MNVSILKIVFTTSLGAVLGGVLGILAGVMIGSMYVEAFNVSDFEGYSSYVVAYCFVPIGAFAGSVVLGLTFLVGSLWAGKEEIDTPSAGSTRSY